MSALVSLGIRPRIATEITQSESRYIKIAKLIESCDYSLHEMSFVQVQWDADRRFRVPGFNMPFECGLAALIATEWNRSESHGKAAHQMFVFEKKAHRLEASLSDFGVDPHIHGGTVDGAILALLNVFSHRTMSVTPELVRQVFDRLNVEYSALRQRYGSVFGPYCFLKISYTATTILRELIEPGTISGAAGERPR